MRRGSVIQLVVLGVLFGAIASAVAVFVPWLPHSAGKEADRIDFVIWFTTWIAVSIFAIVLAVLVYSVWKFRAPPDDFTDGPPIHGNTGLEIVWTAIPALLVTAISVVSAVVLAQNGEAGNSPLQVTVTAQQFAWSFDYGNGVTSGTLRIPVDRKTRLTLHSKDVVHSFWVPQLSQKQDAVPGQTTHLVLTPTRTGTFPVICTELCGLGHAIMRSQVTILPGSQFDAWLAAERKGGGAGGAAVSASKLFQAQGCSSCHTFKPAGSTAKIGPDLDGLAAAAQRAGQPLDAFVRQSIVDPNAYVAPGYHAGVMPTNFGQTLKKNEIDALVGYLTQGGK